MATTFAGSKYTKSRVDAVDQQEDDSEEDEEEEDGESGSTSSFSLQECINEFRARRIRRVSTQSREAAAGEAQAAAPAAAPVVAADAHLINQNRCNKAQERKGKPCKNGFCYCFTSDSGDCASTAPQPPRDWHVRQHKRSRRSDNIKLAQNNLNAQQRRRQSLPPERKQQIGQHTTTGQHTKPLTSVSSLHAVGDNAPLIHIIQELRDNCVISEVRVNREKLPGCTTFNTSRHKSSSKHKASTKVKMQKSECIDYKPTAPALSNISERETPSEEFEQQTPLEKYAQQTAQDKFEQQTPLEKYDQQTPLEHYEQQTPLEEFEQTPLEQYEQQSKRRSSRRSSSGAGGRLLQKRLSHGLVNFKARDLQQPPPKPPRRSTQSLDGKLSLSSFSSRTPSVRDAERVLDEFLRKHGVQLPSSNMESLSRAKNKSKRKSYPLAEIEKPMRGVQLATCPSLSDIERVVESKRGAHYAKNIHMASRKSAVSDKPMKDIMLGWTEPKKDIMRDWTEPKKDVLLGWTEPKINDMLNYDSNKQSQFKTHAPEPAPQVAGIGWQLPVAPKISLDTVDGVSDNLAVNMEQKHTPIKYPRLNVNHNKHSSQKFIWGEQWRNLSNKRTGLRNKSKNFLNNSKNKILRFVSPKKSNRQEQQQQRHSPHLCNVGVQTSSSQLQMDLHSQSPPGSYHSPVQSTPSGTTTTTASTSTRRQTYKDSSEQTYFDFQRKVKPPKPPKKQPTAQRARKLNFQGDSCTTAPAPATYRSFHKDLDQDVTITKMGYLLSSIRAKLEASDEHAVRTFRECSRFTPVEHVEPPRDAFDCIDGPSTRTQHTATTLRQRYNLEREPIYSEIEEDCMRISGSPQFDVRTEALLEVAPTPTPTPTTTATATATIDETTPVPTPSPSLSQEPPIADLNALYAKVQKVNKSVEKRVPTNAVKQPRPLGQFLQESMMNGSFFKFMPLPDEPASDASYALSSVQSFHRASEQPTLPMHQSLNNINEQHSPPKQHRNLSKSELSLQRSEIFLENLCRSEIVLDQDDNVRLEKVQNSCLRANNASAVDVDTVSYDMPNEVYDDYVLEDANASGSWTNPQSQYGSVQMEPPPPSSDNQSTPKKQSQRFTTKASHRLCIDINDGPSVSGLTGNLVHSCPTTPQQPEKPSNVNHAHSSLGELVERLPSDSQLMSVSALARYRLLKDALRRSYRKGKDFFVAEKQRLTQSLSMSRDQSNQTETELDSSSCYASFNVDTLLNDSLTTTEQLSQAVSICRQVPELEISPEMVEAERLLLFSSLRQRTLPAQLSEAHLAARRQSQCFLLDGLQLPVKADASQDMFFNYYYICTVECEGRILSTQSIECQNGAAVFRDCGLEFFSGGQAEHLELRCQIFMLRLRKVSTLSLEPPKMLLKRGSGNLGSGSSSNSSHCEQIVSRFRLHASFTLKAKDLVPYELVASETQASDKIWLRSSRTWQLPLTPHTNYSNLMPQIALSGRVELRLPKLQHAGYLNVQDTQPNKKHNWNRRWCTLDGLHLSVWQHEHNLSEQPPLLAMQLEDCRQLKFEVAPREMCARARSFLLHCTNSEAFFAADTQPELLEWLLHLNEALDFSRSWLSAS